MPYLIFVLLYSLSLYPNTKAKNMKTIIFKSEKNAKVYEIRSAKDQGCFKAGELMRRVKTDNIEKLNQDGQYQVTVTEVK